MSTVSVRSAQIRRRRRVAAVLGAVAAMGIAAAVVVPSSGAEQPPAVHAYIAHDGATIVSGYDGGVSVTGNTP